METIKVDLSIPVSIESPFAPLVAGAETITLCRTTQGWVARFSDPQVIELFGTDTLPTPFTLAASEQTVLAEIRERNPGVIVTVG